MTNNLCLASYRGAIGDCVRPIGHNGNHQGAHDYAWTPEGSYLGRIPKIIEPTAPVPCDVCQDMSGLPSKIFKGCDLCESCESDGVRYTLLLDDATESERQWIDATSHPSYWRS